MIYPRMVLFVLDELDRSNSTKIEKRKMLKRGIVDEIWRGSGSSILRDAGEIINNSTSDGGDDHRIHQANRHWGLWNIFIMMLCEHPFRPVAS